MSSLGSFSPSHYTRRLFPLIRAEHRIEAIDWVKGVDKIIGSFGHLVWASLLENRRHIHHSGDGVEQCVR
jgi:hypothetical protein